MTADNIGDPDISLNHKNLQYVCQTCHNRIDHHTGRQDRKARCRFTADRQPYINGKPPVNFSGGIFYDRINTEKPCMTLLQTEQRQENSPLFLLRPLPEASGAICMTIFTTKRSGLSTATSRKTVSAMSVRSFFCTSLTAEKSGQNLNAG